jgi:hypothetical protein
MLANSMTVKCSKSTTYSSRFLRGYVGCSASELLISQKQVVLLKKAVNGLSGIA